MSFTRTITVEYSNGVAAAEAGMEKKEIIGSGQLGLWASGGVSRQDGVNFRTNMVTLAQWQDSGSGNPLGLSATWACVNLLAGTIASLPLMVYRTVNGIRTVARDHPLYYVLHESPNFDLSPTDFWEFMAAGIELQGNAYATIERSGDGRVYSLTPVRPDLVQVRRGSGGMLEYEWTEDGRRQKRAVDDVLHIRGAMGNALGGVSTLTACRGVFSAASAAETAARATFANGLRPTGVFQTDQMMKLTKDQRDEFNANLADRYQGAVNAGRPLLLDGGMKWQAVNITPEDAQMLESRRFGGEEICRLFQVPPFMVGYTEKSTSWGTGLEQQMLMFLQISLRKRLKRIEHSLKKQLLTAADRVAGIEIEFNVEGLLRGDSAGRAAFYESGLKNKWRTVNEVRALENLPPVPWGDRPWGQEQDIQLQEDGSVPPAENQE